MLRLAVLCSVVPVLLISGLIRTSEDISGFEDNWLWSRAEGGSSSDRLKEVQVENPLWSLKLGGADLEDLKLKRGSNVEEEGFEDAFGSIIEELEQRQNKVVNKKNSTHKTKEEFDAHDDKLNKQLKNDIMRIVNKFVLSTSKIPDLYLNDSDMEDEPSLALYFKGPYTALTVESGRKQWHYFLGTTSPLPPWFYQPRKEDDEEPVPSDVRTDFYKALLHMLQMFLSFPV